jgi:hypothetical protein
LYSNFKSYPIFKIITNFLNHTQFSKSYQIFKIILNFQNCIQFSNHTQFSKSYHIFKIITSFQIIPNFQNQTQFLKSDPIFQNNTLFSKSYLIFKIIHNLLGWSQNMEDNYGVIQGCVLCQLVISACNNNICIIIYVYSSKGW